jgi:hypothetical protein
MLGTHVDILPIDMSRTCTPHTLSHISIPGLVKSRNDPPEKNS